MFKLITAPTSEPITLSEAKLYLKVDNSDEDALITALIVAARDSCERYTNMAFFTQTWEAYFDYLPTLIEFNKSPIQSITKIEYYDSANTLQTLSSSLYDVDLVGSPVRIRKGKNMTYPEVYQRLNAVKITFVAGVTSTAAIPEQIKLALKLTLGHFYENRQTVVIGHSVNEVPKTAEYLLDQYRSHVYW
jgi:uncharacterized phiE125 gp8 family phage protein